MKNIVKLFGLSACLVVCSATLAMADGMVFEPVDMPSTAQTKAPANLPQVTTNQAATQVATQDTVVKKDDGFFDKFKSDEKVADMTLKENQKMQSALTDLDCSQVELRQNLQKLQTNYNSVDQNYVNYKAQRKALKKQIKTVNKKMKTLEKTKETIRKNML